MRILIIDGEGDYDALEFENKYKGASVFDIIENLEDYKAKESKDEFWSLRVKEFKDIDPKFIDFVRLEVQDYDYSKSNNFYLETEIIK